MLLYTSSYTQEKTSKTDEVNQELTDKELENKLYKELILMDNNGVDFIDIADKYIPNINKYINSREEYFRFKAYLKFIGEQSVERKRKNGTLTKNYTEFFEKISNKHKTYAEYLDSKKTDKSKLIWESNTKDGVLRLVVDDLSNFTDEEQRRYDKKMKMMLEDDYFNKLLLTDGKKMMTMGFHSSEQKVESVEESIEVPFSIIDETPTFTFCEALPTNKERKQCLSDNISKHVNRNFNTDLATSLGLEGRQRIHVIFKIDTLGNVVGVKARASHPDLEAEAKRVIGTLPQFIPGKQKGKAVVVLYSLPIVFQVNTDENKNRDNTKSQEERNETAYVKGFFDGYTGTSVPFTKVDEVPTLVSCEKLSNAERKKCTEDGISSYVNKNFNTDLAASLGLVGSQRINVIFQINKQGNASYVNARVPHPSLADEAKRIIYTLPKFVPGKHKGEIVDVLYSLPILFKIKK
jgi:hypothetical protein